MMFKYEMILVALFTLLYIVARKILEIPVYFLQGFVWGFAACALGFYIYVRYSSKF